MLRIARTLRIAVLLVAVCAVPALVDAQVCVGSGSFRDSPVHLGFDLTLADNASGIHAALGFGGRVPFGGVAVAAIRPEGSDEAAKGLVFFGGAELGGGRVFLCPMADLEFLSGPNQPSVEVTGVGVAGGARLGIVAHDGPVRVIPTFGYFEAREDRTFSANGLETKVTERLGVLQFGVGFVGRRLVFGPVLVVPVRVDAGAQLRLGFGLLF